MGEGQSCYRRAAPTRQEMVDLFSIAGGIKLRAWWHSTIKAVDRKGNP
jgi:hypothetical protein